MEDDGHYDRSLSSGGEQANRVNSGEEAWDGSPVITIVIIKMK